MLTTVLEEHFDADELRTWINDYEIERGKHFTENREIFGEEQKIDTNTAKIHSAVALRIYHIRNALVHNKEGEVSRFIPFSGQESILYKETPMLLYIAESLIVKTGKDMVV